MPKKAKVPKMRHTYPQKIMLDAETSGAINFLSEVMIYLWNLGVIQAEEWLQKKEKAITAISFNFWLAQIRATTNFVMSFVTQENGLVGLSEVSSDLSREVLKKLAGSYQSFFELKKKGDWAAKKPSIKESGQFQALSWSTFKVVGRTVVVPKGGGESLRISIPDYIWSQVNGREIVHITISKKGNDFFLNVVVAEQMPQVIQNPQFFRAIDLGAGDVAVTDSDGSEFLIGTRRPDKYWRDEIASVEARQKLCTKGSRAWNRRAKARTTMHQKGRDQRTSYQRKLAHALLADTKVECIVLSKPRTRLGLALSDGTAKQHLGVQNTGYMFRLITFIKEKAVERGVTVIEIPDPRREGELSDPQVKFQASRKLLEIGMKSSGVSIPTIFTQKSFVFKQ
jgi:transposase